MVVFPASHVSFPEVHTRIVGLFVSWGLVWFAVVLMRYFNSSGDPATFSDLWSYIFGDIWKEMREQQLQASYRWVSVVQGSGGLTTKPLPSQKLTVRTSKLTNYTASAPCIHTLTPTQAVATHYAHTYAFTSLAGEHLLREIIEFQILFLSEGPTIFRIRIVFLGANSQYHNQQTLQHQQKVILVLEISFPKWVCHQTSIWKWLFWVPG